MIDARSKNYEYCVGWIGNGIGRTKTALSGLEERILHRLDSIQTLSELDSKLVSFGIPIKIQKGGSLV